MGRLQYMKWCRAQGLSSDISDAPYPHYYLILWLEARKKATLDGIMPYPEPEKGYLDQDAEVMMAFEVLDELFTDRQEEEKRRAEFRQKAQTLFGGSSSS